MHKSYPPTPADALEIPPALRLVMQTVCKSADRMGFWSAPAAGAATDFEEMTLLDKIYWVYKSRRPVLRGEPGCYSERFFRHNAGCQVSLPPGFRPSERLTLGAVGDLIKVEGLERSRDLLYARVADLIFGQDLCFANLESQLTTQEVRPEVLSDKESPIECCTLEQFEAVKGHRGKNFTVLHTACNHTLDVGLEGVETTLGALEREGIVDVGTNREPSAHGKGRIIHCNGLSIGFASATFSLNGKALPAGSEYLVNVARLCPKKGEPDLSLLKRQIEDCRAQGCDLVIASLHWGYEFEFFPRRSQVDLAHALVEHGADVILGHHPHVVQPVEYYRTRRDPQRIAVIAYSLGSLTWTFSAPHLALSAILNLSFAKGSLQGRPQTYIESARVVPVYRTLAGAGEAAAIQIERLDAGLAAAADEESRQYLAQIGRYAELVFGCSF